MQTPTDNTMMFGRLRGTEQGLIERALAGDGSAFEALYWRHRPRVRATVARFVRHPDEAEDLVQVVFMKAFLGLMGFRGQSAFATWLTRIALNACTSHLRTERARKNRLDEAAGLPPNGREVEDPEAAAVRRERRALVLRGIRSLPAPHQEAMWLHYVQERSYHEIVEELQVPLGTVKVWLYRARNQLREALEKMGVGGV